MPSFRRATVAEILVERPGQQRVGLAGGERATGRRVTPPVLIVLPARNEAPNLPFVVEELRRVRGMSCTGIWPETPGTNPGPVTS